mgnify:CR=1 FL=1
MRVALTFRGPVRAPESAIDAKDVDTDSLLLENQRAVVEIRPEGSCVWCSAISPDGKLIAVSDNKQTRTFKLRLDVSRHFDI